MKPAEECPVCGSDDPAKRDLGLGCCMDPFHDSVYPPPKFQKGGIVPGPGSGDRVPVRLSPGTPFFPRNSGRGK